MREEKNNELPQSPISRQLNSTSIQEPTLQQAPPVPLTPPPSGESPKTLKSSILSFKNILKLFIGLFAIILLLVVLFGVVFPKMTKNTSSSELTVWGVMDQKTMDSALADFKSQNPQIKVTYEKEDPKDYRDRLVSKIKNGTGPDIFMFNNTWYKELSDVLLPIPSDVMKKNTFDNFYYPVVKKDLVKNGAIYGIPLGIDTLALYVNTDLFKQNSQTVPKTWDDFVTVARSLTVKDQTGSIKTSGGALGTYDNVLHASDLFSLLMVQDGVDLGTLSPKEKISDALNFYTSFAQQDSKIWDTTLDPSVLAFSKGNLAMLFGFYSDYQNIKSANPNLHFDIAPVPQLTGQVINIANYLAYGISARGTHQKETILLMKYLSQKGMAEKLSVPSAIVGEKATNGPTSVFSSQAQTAVSSYLSSQTDDGINSKLSSALSSVINAILNGTQTTDSGAENLMSSFSQTLNQ